MSSQSDRAQVAGTTWDPGLYQKFDDHRSRPGFELLDRIRLSDPALIYDLGCGTGDITDLLASRWPSARVVGVDNSAEMLTRASANPSRVEWIEADIRSWEPEEPPDLIFANASLQWVADHDQLFPRLMGFLEGGGTLAVQMPLSWHMPSHRLMRETLANGGPGATPIGPDTLRKTLGRNWVENAATFYDLLADDSKTLDIWETEYLQTLTGDDPVLEWVKATGLRPVLHGLEKGEREIYLEEYRQRLREAYPQRKDGTTLFPFRRLFIVATKQANEAERD